MEAIRNSYAEHERPFPANGAMQGVASNWLCTLRQGDRIEVTGPYGATFLVPDDPDAGLLMNCTGTAPLCGFTRRRRRTAPNARGKLHLAFGARSPEKLPFFGPLQKHQRSNLDCGFVYSRVPGTPKEYVQDRLRSRAAGVADLLRRDAAHVHVCGLSGLEEGVESAPPASAMRMASIGRPCGSGCAKRAGSMSKHTEAGGRCGAVH